MPLYHRDNQAIQHRLSLDRELPIPLYYQIRENLRDLILDHEINPGDLLPSERELSEAYAVNRLTVRQAITELVNEGLLRRQHGVGTFVAPSDANLAMPDLKKFPVLTGFTERMLRAGRVPSSRLISFSEQTATRTISQALEIAITDRVFKVIRLRLADNEPIMLETAYLSIHTVPDLTAQELIDTPSLYQLLASHYDIHPVEADEFVEPVVLTTYEADLLGVAAGRPALLQEGTVYGLDRRPIDFTKSLIRGDKARFYFHMRRNGANDLHL